MAATYPDIFLASGRCSREGSAMEAAIHTDNFISAFAVFPTEFAGKFNRAFISFGSGIRENARIPPLTLKSSSASSTWRSFTL